METSVLTAHIKRKLQKEPLLDEQSNEIKASLLVKEEGDLKKVTIPGHVEIKHREKKVRKTMKDCAHVAGDPLKLEECLKEFKTILVPYKVRHQEVKKEVKRIIDKTLPTSVWINLTANVDDLDISLQENNFRATVDINTNISAKAQQGILGPKMDVRGSLKCNRKIKVSMTGTVNITSDGQFNLSITNEDIKIEKLCVPSAVEGIRVATYLDQQLIIAKEAIRSKIKKVFDKLLDKQNSKLNFRDDIEKALKTLNLVHQLSDKIWLIPNVKSAFISQIKGTNDSGHNKLTAEVGVIVSPEIAYANTINKTFPEPMINWGVKKHKSVVFLAIEGKAKISTIEEELKKAIDNFITIDNYVADKYVDKAYGTGKVRLYPSDKKVTIAIEIVEKKNEEVKVTIYLQGTPKYFPDRNKFALTDVDFTVETYNTLINVIEWIANARSEIISTIEKHAVWNTGENLAKIKNDLKHFHYVNKDYEVRGGFSDIKYSDVYISKQYLHVYAEFSGNMTLRILSIISRFGEKVRDNGLN
ncbi:MAG: DUF4403 family protein [Candidatus Scalinduaceae bacterium]